MTSIEYKNGMIQALDDLADELENDFWDNERYCKDGHPTREAMRIYVSTRKMITNRILAIQAEINEELDEMSKQA